MAFRTRRRRRGGQWLPTQGSLLNSSGSGSNGAVGDQNSFLTVIDTDHPVAPNSAAPIELILTPADVPDLEAGASAGASLAPYQARNLAEQQGLGYKLEKVVGNLFIAVAPTANQRLTPSVVIASAGLMVREIDPRNPTAGSLASINGENSPLALDNITDPWIWRRSWLLSPANAGGPNQPSSPSGSDNADAFSQVFQPSNTVFTGPFGTSSIETKSKRVIKNEERLFLNLEFRAIGFDPATDPGAVAVAIMAIFDYRIFAKPFVNRGGNRRNASR